MLVDEFIENVDKRDDMVEEHFKGEVKNLLRNPKEWDWYVKNIRPIDVKIIRIANKIMRREFDANTTTFIRVKDVYASQELFELYRDRKAELYEMKQEEAE